MGLILNLSDASVQSDFVLLIECIHNHPNDIIWSLIWILVLLVDSFYTTTRKKAAGFYSIFGLRSYSMWLLIYIYV